VYSIFLALSVYKALFGSLEERGGEGFGGDEFSGKNREIVQKN